MTIALYVRISSAGVNTKCVSRVAIKIFVSRMENFQPRQPCGPNEKVMTFASPGCADARAVGGSFIQRSGLSRQGD